MTMPLVPSPVARASLDPWCLGPHVHPAHVEPMHRSRTPALRRAVLELCPGIRRPQKTRNASTAPHAGVRNDGIRRLAREAPQ